MLPPSEARTPRPVTSVMSGAVTWTTSAPARPETASRATSSMTACAVGAGRQHRQRPVHLEPELGHRPDRMVGLHLGRRRSARRCAWPHHPAPPVPGRRARRRTRRPGRAPPTGRAARGAAVWACQAASRCAAVGSVAAGLPGEGAAGLGFGAAGVLPGLLVQQPQRPPRRRPAVHRLVIAGEPLRFRR